MMLIIAVLRYHASIHPLKKFFDPRKLQIICGFGHILGFVLEVGTSVPQCFLQKQVETITQKYVYAYVIFLLCWAPTLFIALLYYKVYRVLAKQNKNLQSLQSTPVTQSSPISFKILKHVQNRRTLFVCLATVLCYRIGNIFMSLYLILKIAVENNILKENAWISYCAYVLLAAGSNSVNPFIYGIYWTKSGSASGNLANEDDIKL